MDSSTQRHPTVTLSIREQPFSPQRCPKPNLFTIPGEIRNIIYRFVLISKRSIHVTGVTFPEPAIMRTCYLMRQEALPIYFLENSFQLHCTDWDRTYLHKFPRRLQRQLGPEKQPEVNIQCVNFGSWTHKANLLNLLKACHERQFGGFTYQADDIESSAVTGAFEIARTMRAVSWEAVEKILEVYLNEVSKRKGRWGWT